MTNELENARTLQVNCASSVVETEEARSFFQRRLSIFGFCVFALAGTSWLALTATSLASGTGALKGHGPLSLGAALHLAHALVPGALWLTTRKGLLSGRTLQLLDMGTTLGLVALWVALGATIPDAKAGSSVALLAFITGTLARAIVVPSAASRTLTIGVIGGVLLIAVAIWRCESDPYPLFIVVPTACWASSAVTLATIASHTIFGLRREVQQARVLGQYTLETKISEGGMGVVWRARHALLRRPTAVKLLSPRRAGDLAIQRFEREVQLTSRLTHPNTVAIYDYGRTRDGIFYYAMEFLEGTDLERLVAEHGPQAPGRVVHVLTQVCGALAEAHDLGLVHRDVKPANVLLSPRLKEHEVAKIVDFGLVKSLDLDSKHPALSAANTISGTPLYMSPEAIQAPEAVDGRSDLYALGAVAWFLLVGRPPFQGESVVEVCARHLHEKPQRPSEALGHALPPELEDIVLSCLEKRPEARPPDARALRSRLAACAVEPWTQQHAAVFWEEQASSPARAPSSAPDTTGDFAQRGAETIDVRPLATRRRSGQGDLERTKGDQR